MGLRTRLFVDMDGTLAKFRQVAALDELYERGYFAELPPQQNVVDAVRLLIRTAPSIEIFIISSVLFDSHFALDEKNAWLDRNVPELNEDHRLFVPCGDTKTGYVPYRVRPTDFLLDDYTNNLNDWAKAGGQGIKILNGINHTRGSWRGAMLNYKRTPEQLVNNLSEITARRCVQDKLQRCDMSAAALELQHAALANALRYTYSDCEPEL